VATDGGCQNLILSVPVLSPEKEMMTVSLWILQTVGGKHTYGKRNKKKIYRESPRRIILICMTGQARFSTLITGDGV
jgi:hypothetical protein